MLVYLGRGKGGGGEDGVCVWMRGAGAGSHCPRGTTPQHAPRALHCPALHCPALPCATLRYPACQCLDTLQPLNPGEGWGEGEGEGEGGAAASPAHMLFSGQPASLRGPHVALGGG